MRDGGGRSPRAARVVDTIAAVAEFAGVTVPSASAWFERGAPVMEDGRYDLWEIACWHAENCGRRGDGGPATSVAGVDDQDGDDGSRAGWDLRRIRAAALTSELKLKEAQGEVISRLEHDDAMLALVDSFVSGLENLPPKVVPLLTAARGRDEIDGILRDHIRTLRIQLAAKHSPKGEAVVEGAREADEA